MRGGITVSRNNIYRYYVEGEGDKKIIDVLKKDFKFIQHGKVEVFNVTQEHFSNMRARGIKSNTIVILVYDTDRGSEGEPCLKWNIEYLESKKNVKKVVCIPQVENLEDELVRACQIKEVKELTRSKTNTNYKSDLLKCNNLPARLEMCKFDFKKFWNKLPKNAFKKHGNKSNEIKLKKRNHSNE